MTRVLGFVESLCTALTPPALLPSPAHMTACDLLLQHCSQQLVTLSQYPLPPSSLPSCLAALTALACQHPLPPSSLPSCLAALTALACQPPLPPSSLPSCLAALTALACQPHSPQDLPPHAILLEVTKDTVDPTCASLLPPLYYSSL